jgi:hypothetical protein
MFTRVANKRHYHGAGIYIGRPGPWGNPFIIGKDGTRDEVIAKFEYALAIGANDQFKWMRDNAHKLKGQILVCWCHPQPCHGDVLAKLADES